MEKILEKHSIRYNKLGNYYFTEKGAILAENDRVEITKNVKFWLELFQSENFEIPVTISSEMSAENYTTKNGEQLIKEYNEENGQFEFIQLSLYNKYKFTKTYENEYKQDILFYFNAAQKEILVRILEKIEELKKGKTKKVKSGFIQFNYSLKVEAHYDFKKKLITLNNELLSPGDFLLFIKETEEKIKNFLLNGYEKLGMNVSEVQFSLDLENNLIIEIHTKNYANLRDKIELPYDSELALEFLKSNIKFLEPSLLKVKINFDSYIPEDEEYNEVKVSNINTLETTLPFIKVNELNEFRKSEIEKAEVEISRMQNLFNVSHEEIFDIISHTMVYMEEKNITMELIKDLMSAMENNIMEIINIVDMKDKDEARNFLANEMWYMLTNKIQIISIKKYKMNNFVSAIKILKAEQNKISGELIKNLEGFITKDYTLERIIKKFNEKKIERMKNSFILNN